MHSPSHPSRGRAGLELRPERRPGSVSTLEARQGAPGSPGLDLEVAPRVGADLGDDHRGDVRARSRRCARGLTWRLVARAPPASVTPAASQTKPRKSGPDGRPASYSRVPRYPCAWRTFFRRTMSVGPERHVDVSGETPFQPCIDGVAADRRVVETRLLEKVQHRRDGVIHRACSRPIESQRTRPIIERGGIVVVGLIAADRSTGKIPGPASPRSFSEREAAVPGRRLRVRRRLRLADPTHESWSRSETTVPGV